jgi:predicted DNA-binding transcriptional regulator YafY
MKQDKRKIKRIKNVLIVLQLLKQKTNIDEIRRKTKVSKRTAYRMLKEISESQCVNKIYFRNNHFFST